MIIRDYASGGHKYHVSSVSQEVQRFGDRNLSLSGAAGWTFCRRRIVCSCFLSPNQTVKSRSCGVSRACRAGTLPSITDTFRAGTGCGGRCRPATGIKPVRRTYRSGTIQAAAQKPGAPKEQADRFPSPRTAPPKCSAAICTDPNPVPELRLCRPRRAPLTGAAQCPTRHICSSPRRHHDGPTCQASCRPGRVTSVSVSAGAE